MNKFIIYAENSKGELLYVTDKGVSLNKQDAKKFSRYPSNINKIPELKIDDNWYFYKRSFYRIFEPGKILKMNYKTVVIYKGSLPERSVYAVRSKLIKRINSIISKNISYGDSIFIEDFQTMDYYKNDSRRRHGVHVPRFYEELAACGSDR